MDREASRKLMEITRKSYDETADEFSASRHVFWPELLSLAERIKKGDRALDLGCGNGRFAPQVHKYGGIYTGIDTSEKLLDIASRFHPEDTFVTGDGLQIPFPNASFDIIYSFAVIHHIPGNGAHRQFAQECTRVLRPGGTLILTAWDVWQWKFIPYFVSSVIVAIFSPRNRDIGGLILPLGKNKLPRYIHAFTKRGIKKLFRDAGFAIEKVERISRPSGAANIVLIAKRKD